MQQSFSKLDLIANAFIRNSLPIFSSDGAIEMREELPFPDKVLQTLHNLCATAADLARRGEEVARITADKTRMKLKSILDRYKSEGFAESFVDNEGKKRYYLNGRGIIKVCSLFT